MVLQDLGGVIFFTDPLFSHPHAADIATLLRMCDLHNVLHASNPTTARALIPVLRDGADGADRHGLKGALSCSCTCAPCSRSIPHLPGLAPLALFRALPYIWTYSLVWEQLFLYIRSMSPNSSIYCPVNIT